MNLNMRIMNRKQYSPRIETRSGNGFRNLVDLPVQFSNFFYSDLKLVEGCNSFNNFVKMRICL